MAHTEARTQISAYFYLLLTQGVIYQVEIITRLMRSELTLNKLAWIFQVIKPRSRPLLTPVVVIIEKGELPSERPLIKILDIKVSFQCLLPG